mgnify:CR=1 FL=1
MKKIRAAVVGYGNIGKSVVEALQVAPDFEIAGVIRRNGAENKPAELAAYDVVKDITELKDVDVAIVSSPTRQVEEQAKKILALGESHYCGSGCADCGECGKHPECSDFTTIVVNWCLNSSVEREKAG